MSPLVYRILKWTLIVAIGLAVIGTALFSTLVLNPLEGQLPHIEDIVPESLHLYAAKKVADAEAAGFLRTEFWQRLTGTRAYQLWVRSPEWRRSGLAAALENTLAELRVLEANFRVDPLGEVASREVGLGLEFRSEEPPHFLLFLRLRFLARASVALLERGWARGLIDVPVDSAPGDAAILRLSLAPGSAFAELFLTRLKDVLVVGSNLALVQAARARAAGRGASFRERVGALPSAAGNPIGFRMTPEPGNLAARWSDALIPRDLDPLVRTFLEAVDVAGLTGLAGRFHLDRSPHVAVQADFHPGSLRPFQAELLRAPAADIRRAMEPFVRMAPREVMAFCYAELEPRRAARFVEDTLDGETRKLVEDTLARTPLRNLTHLFDRWLNDLEPGMALLLNRQEFQSTPVHPPYPGITVVFRMKDNQLWQRIHFDLIEHLKQELTIVGARLEQPSVDVELMLYRFQANPWGAVATPAFARLGNLVAFSTSTDFLRRMVDIFLGYGQYGLARSGEVERLFEGPRSLERTASLFLLLDVRRSLAWVDDMAPSWARAASLQQQLDSAPARRRSLELQARGLRQLSSEREREQWVDERMDEWMAQIEAALKSRISAVVGPMVQNLGIVHTLGLTLAPAGEEETPALNLRGTFHFDP
ncbi:MAG: hypothetical protein JXQ29_11410 [Planctomycetes bacterium]|nr:hypothetical protein [Planctomycetota bacterium]